MSKIRFFLSLCWFFQWSIAQRTRRVGGHAYLQILRFLHGFVRGGGELVSNPSLDFFGIAREVLQRLRFAQTRTVVHHGLSQACPTVENALQTIVNTNLFVMIL